MLNRYRPVLALMSSAAYRLCPLAVYLLYYTDISKAVDQFEKVSKFLLLNMLPLLAGWKNPGETLIYIFYG